MSKLNELLGKSELPLPVVYINTQNGDVEISNKVINSKDYKVRGIMITPHIEVSVKTESLFYTWKDAKNHATENGAHLLSAKHLETYIKAKQAFKETILLLQENSDELLSWLWQGQPTWCEEEEENNKDSSLAYTIEFDPADCRLENKSLHYWCRLVWYH